MSYRIQRTTFKVSDFIGWYNTDSLILNPDFQRRSVWDNKSKSYLIDTIIRGLPIPVLILRDKKTSLDNFLPMKEVVDGQQRLRAVLSFVLAGLDKKNPDFKLSKIHNEIVGGNNFSTLPTEAKQEILDYEFFVHVLPSTVSNREILEIFSRMNSTGKKLNDQELRNASFHGEFKSLAFNLANTFYDYWINWGVFTDAKIARMEEVEFVNDLLILSLAGVQKRTPEFITSFYKDYDDEGSILRKDLITSRIKNVMEFINETYGQSIKGSELSKTPILYSLFSVIYDSEFGLNNQNSDNKKVNINKNNFREKLHRLSEKLGRVKKEWKENKSTTSINERIYDAYSRGTSGKENREIVLAFMKKELL